MKKKHLSPLCLAALLSGSLFFFASCEKEDGFSLKIFAENFNGNSKLIVNGASSNWQAGDQIYLNGDVKTVEAYSGGGFCIPNIHREEYYWGIYPSSIYNSVSGNNVTVTLPSTYSYRLDGSGNQILESPMAVYQADEGENTALYFKHLTSALVVRIKNSVEFPITIDQVVISSDSYNISGSRTIDMTDIPTSADATVSGGNSVSMTFRDVPLVIESNNTADVQIPLAPVGSGNKFTVRVSTHFTNANGNKKYLNFEKEQNTGGALGRSQIAYAMPTIGRTSSNCYEDLPMAYNEGTRTYTITTAEEYILFIDAVNSISSGRNGNFRNLNYELGNDIDMNGYNVSSINDFRGTFNGNNKTISNLYIRDTNTQIGMFGYRSKEQQFAYDLTLSNVTLEYIGSNTSANVSMGALVGDVAAKNIANDISNVTVNNVTLINPNTNGVHNMGGLIGKVSSGSNTENISNCTVDGMIFNNTVGRNAYVGGLIGAAECGACNLSECNFTMPSAVSFSMAQLYYGGFIGFSTKTLSFTNCSATHNVTLTGGNDNCRIGGAVGTLNQNHVRTITYNSSSVSGTINVTRGHVNPVHGYVASPANVTVSGTPDVTGLTINQPATE